MYKILCCLFDFGVAHLTCGKSYQMCFLNSKNRAFDNFTNKMTYILYKEKSVFKTYMVLSGELKSLFELNVHSLSFVID